MSIIRVLIEELLCKAVTAQILVLEFVLSGAHWCLRVVLSCLTLNGTPYRGISSSGTYPLLENPQA
jgi:hypothetical protein